MDKKQKKIFLTLLALSMALFIILVPLNAGGAESADMLKTVAVDHAAQYAYVVKMLPQTNSVIEILKKSLFYEHYIYGFPFYGLSALSVFPVRLSTGAAFSEQVQLNVLILRQMISVLPMLAAILIMVYLQTRFRSWWKALGLFVFLAIIPGLARNNIRFWHPDALALFFSILALYFLDRDQFRFSGYFYLAAICCGLTIGTKLYGVFFFLAIAVYLAWGWKRRAISWKRMIMVGVFFVLIMTATVFLSNPAMLFSDARTSMMNIQQTQSYYVLHGWNDGVTYRTGLVDWIPVWEDRFGSVWFIGLAVLSLLVLCWKSSSRKLGILIFTWIVPYSIYLIGWVAIKPFHYWFPVMLPLLSCVIALPETGFELLQSRWKKTGILSLASAAAFTAVIVLAILFQAGTYIRQDFSMVQSLQRKVDLYAACNSRPLNQRDGKPAALAAGNWYQVITYDLTTDPPTYAYDFLTGPGEVVGDSQKGRQAWKCNSQERAQFHAEWEAKEFGYDHPTYLITGPGK